MTNPVALRGDNVSYDYSSIVNWVRQSLHVSSGFIKLPLHGTNIPITSRDPNDYLSNQTSLREEIASWIEVQSQLHAEDSETPDIGVPLTDMINVNRPTITIDSLRSQYRERGLIKQIRKVKFSNDVADSIKLGPSHIFLSEEECAQHQGTICFLGLEHLCDPFTGRIIKEPVFLPDGTRLCLSTLEKYKDRFLHRDGYIYNPLKEDSDFGESWSEFLKEIKPDDLTYQRISTKMEPNGPLMKKVPLLRPRLTRFANDLPSQSDFSGSSMFASSSSSQNDPSSSVETIMRQTGASGRSMFAGSSSSLEDQQMYPHAC